MENRRLSASASNGVEDVSVADHSYPQQQKGDLVENDENGSFNVKSETAVNAFDRNVNLLQPNYEYHRHSDPSSSPHTVSIGRSEQHLLSHQHNSLVESVNSASASVQSGASSAVSSCHNSIDLVRSRNMDDHIPSGGPDLGAGRTTEDSLSTNAGHSLPYLNVSGPNGAHSFPAHAMSFSGGGGGGNGHQDDGGMLQQQQHPTSSHATAQQVQSQSQAPHLQHVPSHYHYTSSMPSNFAQSAPPTVTSFVGVHSPVTSPPPPPPPPYTSYTQAAYYAPSTASFGQSFIHQQQQQQQAYNQTVNSGQTVQQPQHSTMGSASANGNVHSYFNSGFGLLPSSGFASDSVRSPAAPPTPSSAHAMPLSATPQHYYHSGLPSPTDDFRRLHVSASQAPRSASSLSYQPYPMPSQFHRPGAPSLLSGTSIITTNPDTLPDLRYSDAPLSASAQYGRLPDGKIIELYPAMMRTIQACEYCRSRKAKCTGGMPCERCQKKNVKCEYAQLDKKRKVKTTTSQYDLNAGGAGAGRHGDPSGSAARAQAILSAKASMSAGAKKTQKANVESCTGASTSSRSPPAKEDRMQLRSSVRGVAARRSRNLDVGGAGLEHLPQPHPSSFDSVAQWQALVTPPPINVPSAVSSESSDRGSPAIHPNASTAVNDWRQLGNPTFYPPPHASLPYEAKHGGHQPRLLFTGLQAAYGEEDSAGSPLDRKYDLYT